MSAGNDLSMTFSEDDLRPSRISQRSTAEKLPEKIERRDKIPRTPPQRAVSFAIPERRLSLDDRPPSNLEKKKVAARKIHSAEGDERENRMRQDVERRMRLLEDREKEEKARTERLRKEEEKLKKLKEDLEKKETERHQKLLEQRSGLESPEDLPTPSEAAEPPVRATRKTSSPKKPSKPGPRRSESTNSRYSRFSDFKYYNWSSDEEESRRDRNRPQDDHDHDHDHSDGLSCELCFLGREFEQKENQKKKKPRGYIDESCRLVEEYAKQEF
ncbi:hypothetical protein L596_018395 [Steinernema carpocapsae]|uniref:Uncharacterized protein n=1 Tax=Steinernema carpocapsae TaxID=34508 RepID=A0A4V6A214_STECR|nr:hypothetical protein L596_018395 [Steinernema carpocapsae]